MNFWQTMVIFAGLSGSVWLYFKLIEWIIKQLMNEEVSC